MSYYSVNRDDSELRVVICPKCSTHEKGCADVTKFSDIIPYKKDGYLLRLMQCNVCKTYFTFYREDGLRDITRDEAIKGLDLGHCDMQADGKDCHGHSFYIVFKNKPPTISDEKYDELMGFKQDNDGNYNEEDEIFNKAVDVIPSINQLVRYHKMIENIDFEGMKYIENTNNRICDYFKE